MANRTLTMTEWFRLVKRHAFDDGFSSVSGYPVADVAHRLKVTKQRIYQLLEDGALDTVQLTTKAGKVTLTLVTEASLERYIEHRVPYGTRQGYFSFPETA